MDKEQKIKRSVDYKILIKDGNQIFKLGTIIIRTYQGDILYVPSEIKISSDCSKNEEIDHIAWHINGQVHIKKKNAEKIYHIVQKNGERLKMSESGYQEMIRDYVCDITKLPAYTKKVAPLDVVFDIQGYLGGICFFFSIVSGKLIAAQYLGKSVPLILKNTKKDPNIIGYAQRALGWHCGHADVMLQYSLDKAYGLDLKTNRRFFIPYDIKISKKQYEG